MCVRVVVIIIFIAGEDDHVFVECRCNSHWRLCLYRTSPPIFQFFFYTHIFLFTSLLHSIRCILYTLVVPERKKSIQKIWRKKRSACVCTVLYRGLIVQVISIRNSISLVNAILFFSSLLSVCICLTQSLQPPSFTYFHSRTEWTHTPPHTHAHKANHIEQTHIDGGMGTRRKIDAMSRYLLSISLNQINK